MIPPSLRRRLRRVARRLEKLEGDRLARAGEKLPFGLDWLRRYLPHYVSLNPSQIHHDLAADLSELTRLRGERRNYVAPRGTAKTTWISRAFPMNRALEGAEPLILLTAETGDQAKAYLSDIKDEIEGNPLIARDYPESAGRGRVWQAAKIQLRNGVQIVARGSKGRILGMGKRGKRPSLIVVDDGNERGDAYSPTTRQRRIDWLVRDLLPAGSPETNVVVAGTAIHREAIVCYLRTAGWRTREYWAMYREPDRLDLWEEWGRVLTNLANPQRETAAREFYLARAGEMNRGAELLWPERLTLYDLMAYRVMYGPGAYRTEYTPDPGSPEGAEWPAEYFEWPGFWFEEWPHDLVFKVLALDPSKGADAKAGDFQAHAQVGLAKDGTLYIDCDLRHETPEAMCLRSIGLAREWGRLGRPVDSIVLQDNGTMGLLATAMQIAEGQANAVMPWQCLTETDPKPLRIRVAAAWLYQKRIRVRSTPGGRQLVEQWRDFPFATHDDGPDAVATGIIRVEEMAGWRR